MDEECESPLKIGATSKRKRLSVDRARCIICQENIKHDKLSTATDSGVHTLIQAARVRNDDTYERLTELLGDLNKVERPYCNSVFYHRKCVASYTSKRNLAFVSALNQIPMPGSSCMSDVFETQSTNKFGRVQFDWLCCIICKQKSYKRDSKLHRIETFERDEQLKHAAEACNDEELLLRIRGEDLIAREALYHNTCIKQYLRNAPSDYSKHVHIPIPSCHDAAFNELLTEIHNDIFTKHQVFLMSDLLSRFQAKLPNDLAQSYSSQKLQQRLITHYGDSISVLTQKGQGQSNMIISSDITMNEAVCAARKLKDSLKNATFELNFCSNSSCENEHLTILHKAAGILRAEMRHTDLPKDYPGPSHVSQEESVRIMPPMLSRFVAWLISKEAYDSVESTESLGHDKYRKCLALTECILSCSNNIITPLQLGLAVQLYHELGSRKVIETLNAYGFCISYDELRRFLTSLAQQEAEKIQDGVYIPCGIKSAMEGGRFVHEGDDNVDINTETIDGKNTFHSMARAVFQESGTDPHSESLRIKRTIEKTLVLTDQLEEITQIQRFEKPTKRPEPPRYNNAAEKIKPYQNMRGSTDLPWLLLRLLPRDILPLPENLVHLKYQVIPFWTGFNHTLSEPKSSCTNVSYAPTINAKPSDMETIFTTMKKCRSMTDKLGQEYAVQTMDQQLYAVAQQVKWSIPDQFPKHFIRLGGFHTLCCYISALGKIWGDAGLRDILADSGVYAPCTVDQMLQGKQFNRAVRGLTLVYEALAELQISAFIKWCEVEDALKSIPLSLWEQVSEIQAGFASKSQNIHEKVHDLQDLVQLYLEPLLERFIQHSSSKSPTFQFWNTFLQAIHIMLLNTKAVRTGDWELSLQSQSQMLPYIFVSDKMNYSRWLPVYLLEMIHLPDDLKTVFRTGQFSVRQKPGKFNSLWSDMGTEKTVIKDSKGQGGIKGLTQQKSALMRWTLTRHMLGQYTSYMQNRSGIHKEDIKEVHEESQPTSLKRDEDQVNSLSKHLKENMTDPFNTDAHPDVLCNISTGLHATAEVQASLLSVVQTGQALSENFIEKTLDENHTKSLYEPIKKSGLKTFTSMTKKTKLKSGGLTINVNLNPELVFRRALTLSGTREEVSTRNLLSYPIGPVPTSLFHEDGTMRKCSKADLGHKLEEQVDKCTELPDYSAACTTTIRDVMAIIQALPAHQYHTFEELAENFLKVLYTTLHKSHTVIDVYDNYNNKLSIKSIERSRRSAGVSLCQRKYQVIGGRAIPPWQKFLSVTENKTALQNYLTGYIIKHAPQRLFNTTFKIYLAGGFGCGEEVVCISAQGVENVQELYSSQEEADTRLLLHASHINASLQNSQMRGRIIIRSPDTDVLVLAVHYFSKLNQISELWIQAGTVSTTTDHRRFIPVHKICQSLSPVICNVLPAVHALTGCDTVSSFYSIGKRTVFKVLSQNANDFAGLNALSEDQEEQAIKAARHLVVRLYSPRLRKLDSLDELRVKLASQKNISLAKLPPCERSFKEHVKRAAWQTKLWTRSHIPKPDIGSPLEHGWTNDNDNLQPKFFEGPMASELLQDLVCSCGLQNTCSRNCACKTNGMPCTDVCLCAGGNCTNTHASDSNTLDVSDSEEE